MLQGFAMALREQYYRDESTILVKSCCKTMLSPELLVTWFRLVAEPAW
jgi:hypothetical protein